MRSWPVVRRVARSTVGLIRREWPGHGLRVARVAVGADEIHAVVAGVRRRLVDERERCPEVAAVTRIAFELSREVPVGFTRRRRAVVTARAGARNDVRMVETARDPTRRRMAYVALGRRRQMACLLAGCDRAVVAAAAVSDHLRMIDREHGRKRDDGVTVLANVARADVVCLLAERINVVVTAHAITGNVVVVEVGRQPAVRRVAVLACVAACDVVDWLAWDERVVVAADAGADDVQVIDGHDRSKRHDAMAIFANVGCRNVSRWLADGVGVVVTAHAIARDVVVIKIGRHEGIRRMAVVARIAAQDVSRVLADRDRVVVTAHARTDDLQVVDGHGRRECHDAMTIFADRRRVDVIERLADRLDAVMAAYAVAHDVVVIEIRRQPAVRRVAVLARVAACDVIRGFAIGDRIVVAARARAEHMQVVDGRHGRERDDVMTVFANIGRLYVSLRFADRRHVVVAAEAVT